MKTNKKTILVVEDERPLLEAIKIKLEKNGFEVVTARSVEQARNHLQDIKNVDTIWLDHYLLGKENGLDFVIMCKKKNSWCKKIPIFVVSNTASADKMRSYLKLGINKYYVKAEKRLDAIIKEIKNDLENLE
jgi:DNA-binding NtrC family response regulator